MSKQTGRNLHGLPRGSVLCAKVSVRSGTRTVPYASDGSNPSAVQHRFGGNE